MTFPLDNLGRPMSEQSILGAVAALDGSVPVLQVSAVNQLTTTSAPLSADSSSVSAKQGDAGNLRVSAIQSDAANLMVSGKSGDAGLFRVSSIGGTTSPLSADSSSVSAKQGDAANLRVSSIQA